MILENSEGSKYAMPMHGGEDPSWLQAASTLWQTILASIVSAALAAAGTLVATVRKNDINSIRSNARMKAIEVRQQRHEDDCVERNRKLDEIIAGLGHTNAELQRQIQAVQISVAQLATREDIRDLITVMERREHR